ncbi:hypothetical protein ACAG26_11125 [Mycobacterium sp. pUA109]|uniref:hypothetical protein n=1 Tax=Mycobacterium sp. pUA109 TaxID=3238982 RepID=UPI00351B588D
MSNVLDLLDQTAFDVEQATGTSNQLQCFWVYNRAVDIDGLRRLHDHLQQGRLLARRIERSPLPIGRHRWVSSGGLSDIDIAASARPREAFRAWLDEQPPVPLDVQHGPGWHLAVLPFTDGGAGVSMVSSHCLIDGIALCEALANATCGRDDVFAWPAAASRRPWRALSEDMRQTARDTPDIGRAVVAAARLARHNHSQVDSGALSPAGPDESVTIPTDTFVVDADEWDARAHSLGGTSNALLSAFAARLAYRLGRVTEDGLATLTIPVNERGPGDTRAGAVTEIDISIDPAAATTDLREIRAAVKHALIRHREVLDERWALLPLVPLLPQRLLRRIGVVYGNTTRVVSSNLGVINPAANRADGTDADYFAMRVRYSGLTETMLQRAGGLLALVSGRLHGRVFVSAVAYQPGTSNNDLPRRLSSTLDEFSLTGTRLWCGS